MDRETISSYGFILITTMLLALVLALASPIGEKLGEDVLGKANTLLYNTGVLDADASPREYGTIVVHYRYENSSEDFQTYSVSARMNEKCYVDYPEIVGYEPKTLEGTVATGQIVVDQPLKDVYIYYTPITYTVRFVLNGGQWKGTQIGTLNYEYGSSMVLPTNIEREGYKFVGWYEDNGLGGEQTYSIHPTTYGNKVYYAKYSLV